MPISCTRSYTDPIMVLRMINAAISRGTIRLPNPEKLAVPSELYTVTLPSYPTNVGSATRVTNDSIALGKFPSNSAIAMLRRLPPISITSSYGKSMMLLASRWMKERIGAVGTTSGFCWVVVVTPDSVTMSTGVSFSWSRSCIRLKASASISPITVYSWPRVRIRVRPASSGPIPTRAARSSGRIQTSRSPGRNQRPPSSRSRSIPITRGSSGLIPTIPYAELDAPEPGTEKWMWARPDTSGSMYQARGTTAA